MNTRTAHTARVTFIDTMTLLKSVVYIICICVLLQISTAQARSAEERLSRIINSELATVRTILNEYFIDSRAQHDKLISETENFIQHYRNQVFKNFNFKSEKVTSCLRKFLQTEGPIEAMECAQHDAYDNLKRQIFKNISEEIIEKKVKETCKGLEKAKPHEIAACVRKAKNEVVSNSDYDYSKVEKKLDEIYGKAKVCLDYMTKAYNEAGIKAEENCPKS